MFEQLIACQYYEKLKISAVPYIEVERNKNATIYNYILKYAETEKILISEISLLLDKHRYWDEIKMFNANACDKANALIKNLCETFGNCFTLKILNDSMQYNIEYNLKLVCTITSYKLYDKYALFEFVMPVQKQFNNIVVSLVPPILEIINLYKDLYNPLQYDNWQSILINIQELEILLNINTQVLNKACASDLHAQEKVTKLPDLQKPLLDFFSDSGYLLLQHTIGSVLSVVSRNATEYDLTVLTNYLKSFTQLGITYKKRILYLPKEFIMEKTMFYITQNDGKITKRKNIINIYNNLSYELINFVPFVMHGNNFNVVDPITELRFLYIEIWEILISQKLTKLKYKEILQLKLQQIQKYKILINISEYKTNYIGVYVDAAVQRKLYALTQPQKKFSFYCYEVI